MRLAFFDVLVLVFCVFSSYLWFGLNSLCVVAALSSTNSQLICKPWCCAVVVCGRPIITFALKLTLDLLH